MSTPATLEAPPARSRWPHLLGKLTLGLVLVLVALLAIAWFGGRWYLAGSVADYSGEKQVPGLAASVDITYDEMGIPQIWAETDADAYFALGWVHASERLFQMELLRRLATGTLSEILGERAFDTDVRQRQIGFHRLGQRVLDDADAASRGVIDAYVAGVNAWVDQARRLPPEFTILRTQPRPWTPHDVTTAFVYQTWYPSALADFSAHYDVILELVGEDALDLVTEPREWTIPSAPAGPMASLLDPDGYAMRMTMATNNWAVAPERSASGHALHAADPHLAINSIPGFWYLVGLHSGEGLSVLGATAAGVPIFAMAHNGTAKWTFSVAPLYLVDRYIETFHPEDSLQVRTPEGYAPLAVRTEEIWVSGEDEPRSVAVYSSPRGVLIERNGATGMSMHWSGFDLLSGDALDAGLEVPATRDFDHFRSMVRRLNTFSVNWVYSDLAGTIGYQLGPAIPRRSHNPGVPQNAADAASERQGYHDHEMQPWSTNPEQGWLATTNNPPAPAGWPVTIHGTYNYLRMERVTAWMADEGPFDRHTMQQMQLDHISGRAERWKDLAAAGAERIGDGELASRLRAWDGRMAPGSREAALFAVWAHHMTKHLFEDVMGDQWRAGVSMRDVVLAENHALIADSRTAEAETAVDLSARAMADARPVAGGRALGEIQTVHITHPLSQAPLVGRWLNLDRGPIPIGGDTQSLNVAGGPFSDETGTISVSGGGSMRLIMDWAEPDSFQVQLPMGQSGNPFSPHYDDFLALFERDEWWTVPFSREAVEAGATSRVRLAP